MNKNSSSITINGRTYDVRTGLVEVAATPAPMTATTAKTPLPATRRQPARPLTAHTPKHSQTLMRHAVKKPNASLKRRIHVQGHTDTAATLAVHTVHAVKPKPSAHRLDSERWDHARRTPRHQAVQHFSPTVFAGDAFVMTTLPQPAVRHQPVMPPPIHHRAPKTTAEILDHAIQHATSHQQKPHVPARHRPASRRKTKIHISAALAVVVLGLFVLQGLPNLRLHFASATAGFSAALPAYKPAGYHLGQLDYRTGEVAVKFNSNSDNRSYAITERRSPWDSQTLLDSFVAPADKAYETVSAAGRTVYLYGDRNATWIDDGIWYHVKTDNALSSNQLVQLASSM